MITQQEVIMYVDGILKNSAHLYVGTAEECLNLSRQVGRPVIKVVNFAGVAPFAEKHTLSILQTTYSDYDTETVIAYDGELKARYYNNSAFDVFVSDEKQWPVDLQVFYFHEGVKK